MLKFGALFPKVLIFQAKNNYCLPHANYEKLIVLTLKVAQPGIPYLKLLRYLMSKFSIIPPPKDSSSADD